MAQYKIQQGDTLSALARRFGTSVDALMQMNPQIQDRDLIYYDRMMTVPGAGTPPNIVGGPSVASPDQINQAINQYSFVPPTPSSAVDYAQSITPNQDEIDKAVASSGSFADAFGSVKDYINASRQEQLAKEQQTGTATGIPVIEPPKMQARSQEGQPTMGELLSSIDPSKIAGITTGGFDPSVLEGQPSVMDTLKPIKESVVKSANDAGQAVSEIIQQAPDTIKGALSSFANNEVAAILGGINKADRFIKEDMSFLMKKYSDSIKDKAGEGAESFAKNIGIIRKDFIDTLSDFAQDNNLDMQSLVEAIDVDALYDATGIRNRRKERELRLAEQRRLELERQRRMAVNQRTSGVPISSYAKGGLAEQARNVAAQGRFGDSMLLHVNPAEVAGLSQVMPLTVNPETGQPEAFLPFLLPILGSIGGSALAGSSLLAGTALAGKAALLGAVGSGLGTYAATGDAKKGLMSGLMGYGLGKVLGAGPGAAEKAKDTAFAASVPETATLASTPTNAMADFTSALAQNPNLGYAQQASSASFLDNLKTIGSSPKQGIAGAIAQSAKPSSFIPMYTGAAGYGLMNSQEQFQRSMEALRTQDEDEYNRILAEHPEYVPMLQNQTFQRGGRTKEQLKKEFKPTAAIEAREIDPFFMPGFQAERAYLRNVNPSSGQIISGQSGYAFGTESADAPMSAPFDPTQTTGYQSFYNAPVTPYVLDPFQKQTFERGPAPIMPDPVPVPLTETVADAQPNVPIFVPPVEETRVEPFNPASVISPDSLNEVANMFTSGMSREAREERDTGIPTDIMDMIAPPMSTSTPIMPTNEPMMMMDTSGLSNEELESGAFDPMMMASVPMTSSILQPPPPMTDFIPRGQDRAQRRGRRRKAEGGKTYPNEGLEALAKSGKKGKEAVEAMGYQEGGLTQEAMSDPVTQEVVRYISGESGNDEIISQFVNKYGNEAFMQLREMILQQMSGGQSQTEGLISGANMGGMTDDLPMTISGDPAAVSQGEYIVPADVVSGLGDGDTNSGARVLDDMLDNVRLARTGTTKQAPKLSSTGALMPA